MKNYQRRIESVTLPACWQIFRHHPGVVRHHHLHLHGRQRNGWSPKCRGHAPHNLALVQGVGKNHSYQHHPGESFDTNDIFLPAARLVKGWWMSRRSIARPLAHQTITTTKANQGPRDNPRDLEPNLRIQGPNLGTSGCKLRDPAYGPREHT